MSLTIPPFSQFQGPLIPLRGLWNHPPPEGDYFINAEIDWGSANTSAVQFSVSGNSPVALSQIVALYIDNRRCGVDCDFLFPDSGFLLTVPAHAQGLFPVLTNALMFYAIAAGSAAVDVTVLQILNSLPPPIPLVPSIAQNNAAITGAALAGPSTVPVIPAGISGTLNTLSLSLDVKAAGASDGHLQVALVDGTGLTLWVNYFVAAGAAAPITANYPINLSGLALRFRNGLSLVVSDVVGIGFGTLDCNAYYSTP
jgi:hypothetical protein